MEFCKVICIFLLGISLSFAQQGTAIYGFRFKNNIESEMVGKIDSIKTKSVTIKKFYSKIKDDILKVGEEIDDVTFTLTFNNKYSLFEVTEQVEPMDIDNNSNSFKSLVKDAFTKSSRKYNYFFKTKKVVQQSEFEDKNYLITIPLDSIGWKLENEQKKIGKFICYKAVTLKKRKYPSGIRKIPVVAWYCPSIPIPVGPYEYNGLPGLIVQLNEGKRFVYLKTLNLGQKQQRIRVLKGTKISKKEFEKIWRIPNEK